MIRAPITTAVIGALIVLCPSSRAVPQDWNERLEAVYSALEVEALPRLDEHATELTRILDGLRPSVLAGLGAHDFTFLEAAHALVVVSQSAIYAGRIDEALGWIETAEANLAGFEERDEFFELAWGVVQGRKFEVLLAMGLPDRALTCLREEERIALGWTAQEPLYYVSALVHRADLYLAARRFEAAQRFLGDALSSAHLPERCLERVMLELRLAVAQWELAYDDEQWREQALAGLRAVLTDELAGRGESFVAELRLAEISIDAGDVQEAAQHLKGAEEHLIELSMSVPGGGGPLEHGAVLAATQSQLARIAKLDPDARAQRHARLESAFDQFVQHWTSIPARKGGVGFLTFGRRRFVLAELVRGRMQREPDAARIEHALEAIYECQAIGSLVRSSGRAAGDLRLLRRKLAGSDTGFLVYLPGRDLTHVFAFDAETALQAEIADPREIEVMRRRYVAELMQRPAGTRQRDLRALETRLADMLLPAAVRELVTTWRGVTVVGLDLIGYLPFELLAIGDERRLEDAIDVSYIPSLPLAFQLYERASPFRGDADLDLLLVAAPDIGEQARLRFGALPRIPFGAAERAKLVDGFDPERVRVVEGRDATLTALRERPACTVLHVLAHGIDDETRERSAGLLLAPSATSVGDVWCEDVESLAMPPLVMLSVCEAGRGPLRRGDDGVSTLSGTLLGAGARAVVISPKRLDYDAVLTLTAVFNERLMAGASPANALSEARRALARTPAFADPYFRLIHVVGLGHEPVFDSTR